MLLIALLLASNTPFALSFMLLELFIPSVALTDNTSTLVLTSSTDADISSDIALFS